MIWGQVLAVVKYLLDFPEYLSELDGACVCVFVCISVMLQVNAGVEITAV